MENTNVAVAMFATHAAAEDAVKKLTAAGFAMTDLSVVGKGYHTEETVIGFYNIGDRVKFWGANGVFWGALWGLFSGGLFLTVPVVGQVVVLGYLAAVAISVVEGAAIVGGISALGAALFSIGVPKNSIIQYETALKADGFLVTARGTAQQAERARSILGAGNPSMLDMHSKTSVANAAE